MINLKSIVFISLLAITTSPASAALFTYSFDDGYNTVYSNAFPILEKYGHSAVAFVVSDRPENTARYKNYMNTSKVLDLQAAGWEIGSHSIMHVSLEKLPLKYEHETLNNWQIVEGLDRVYAANHPYQDFSMLLINGERSMNRKNSLAALSTAGPNSYFLDNANNTIYIRTDVDVAPSSLDIRVGSAQREIEQSATDLRSLGFEITSFAAPFNRFNLNLYDLTQNDYSAVLTGSCTFGVCGKVMNETAIDPGLQSIWLARFGTIATTELQTVYDLVDAAIASDSWLNC